MSLSVSEDAARVLLQSSDSGDMQDVLRLQLGNVLSMEINQLKRSQKGINATAPYRNKSHNTSNDTSRTRAARNEIQIFNPFLRSDLLGKPWMTIVEEAVLQDQELRRRSNVDECVSNPEFPSVATNKDTTARREPMPPSFGRPNGAGFRGSRRKSSAE